MDCHVHAAAGRAKECNVAVGVVCPAVTGDGDDMADLLLSVNLLSYNQFSPVFLTQLRIFTGSRPKMSIVVTRSTLLSLWRQNTQASLHYTVLDLNLAAGGRQI